MEVGDVGENRTIIETERSEGKTLNSEEELTSTGERDNIERRYEDIMRIECNYSTKAIIVGAEGRGGIR